MLTTIVRQSVELVKFISALKLKAAPLQHVTNVANALVVASERRKKTLAALHRQHVAPPTDAFALADSFRQSPWQAEDVRHSVPTPHRFHRVHDQLAALSAGKDRAPNQQGTRAIPSGSSISARPTWHSPC